MSWTWQLEKEDGNRAGVRAGLPKETFSSQGRRGELDRRETGGPLLDGGVDQVTLLEEGRAEYGPMSLHPPGGSRAALSDARLTAGPGGASPSAPGR